MPLTPMGSLFSRTFPSSKSVLLSESLPSCRWTDCCSTTLSAARVDELNASDWLFNRPSTKSARDYRGFPLPESVHLLAVLPVVQGRASRVLTDCNNHLLAASRMQTNSTAPANRSSLLEEQLWGSLTQFHCQLLPRKQPLASLHPTKPTVPLCSLRLTTLGKPKTVSLTFHIGVARTDPLFGHPKGKLNGFTAPAAGNLSLTFHRLDEPGEPRTAHRHQAEEKRCTRKDTETIYTSNAKASIPRTPSARCLWRTRSNVLRSPDGYQQRIIRAAFPKKHLSNSPKSVLEDTLMLDRLDSLSKLKPAHQNHTWILTSAAEFRRVP